LDRNVKIVEARGDMGVLRRYLICPAAAVLCVVVALVALGCETQQEMTDPKGTLERVAQEYWNKRLLQEDYESTYEMELEKGSLSFKEYVGQVRNMGQITYVSIGIDDITIDKDRGEVMVKVVARLSPVPKDLELSMQDAWVIQSGEWKHVLPKKKGL
jgi:hypothetical protein